MRGVAIRGWGRARLRRLALRRPGFVALACALYLVAGVAATEPAIGHGWSSYLASGAPGRGEAAPGDHLQTGYNLWLAGHQLEHGRAPWVDPYSFRPESEPRPNPAWWPFGLPYWPLVAALGPVLAWNLFVLLGFLGAGGAACAWLRELGLSRGAAFVGGLAFAVAPYRVAQSRGHLLGPISILLPLSLFAFERARRTGQQRWWWISRAAVVSIPLSGQVHLALGAIPFYVLYAVCRSREARVLIETAIGVVAAVLAALLIRLTVIAGTLDAGGRSLKQVDAYSAEWLDFVTRHVRHGAESFVFLGWATPLAAAAALWLLARGARRGLAVALGVGAAVPMLLALGTNLPLYSGLWHALPPFRYPRVPERLMPVAVLCLAALVAFGLDELVRRARGRSLPLGVPVGALAAVLAAVVVAADLHVRVFGASAADGSNAAYAAVRAQPPGRLLELPVFLPDVHYGSVYLSYEMQAHRQRPGGYSTTAPRSADEIARKLQPLGCGDWTTGAGKWIPRLRVTALTLHRGLYVGNPVVTDTAWFAWRGLVEHGYRPVRTDGAVTAFAPGPSDTAPPFPEPPREDAVFCEGWYAPDERGRQMRSDHAALWVHGAGIARLFVSSPEPLPVRLSVDGRPHARLTAFRLGEVQVGLVGDGWHLLALDAERLPQIGGKPRGARIVAYALPRS